MNRLKINFLGVDMENPIMTASGCFGFGMEYKDYFDPNELGAVVLKGITLEPRNGNEGTRIAETPSGMLNCVGLENPGIENFKKVILEDIKGNVITSYSIHYTKLYDRGLPHFSGYNQEAIEERFPIRAKY